MKKPAGSAAQPRTYACQKVRFRRSARRKGTKNIKLTGIAIKTLLARRIVESAFPCSWNDNGRTIMVARGSATKNPAKAGSRPESHDAKLITTAEMRTLSTNVKTYCP
jgi:hypothetical protein